MADLHEVIGEPSIFLDEIFKLLGEIGIDTSRFECDHVCFRCATEQEYKHKQKELEKLGTILSEAVIGGRLITTYKFNQPIVYKDRKIRLIELPSPKGGSPYATGLEHAEFVIDKPFDLFMRAHPAVKFDTRGMDKARNADISVKLAGGRYTVKFHHQPLDLVIEEEIKEEKELAAKRSK